MKHQARGSKSLAFFFGSQIFIPNGMRGKLGRKLGKREQMRANWGPKYARLRAGEDPACTRLTISCAGIVNLIVEVSCLYQKRCNRNLIEIRYSTYSLYMGNSTQFLHNLSSFLYTTSSGWRLHCSRKSMSVWRPCSFRQKTSGEFRPECARGLSGLSDLVPLTKQRVRGRVRLGTRALASARRIWGPESIGLAAWRLCKVHAITSNR